jgi:thiamine pyrophosphate-dependent acetolactate synthase large subunit-like protein
MNRSQFIEKFAAVRGDAAVISGPGTTSRLVYTTGHLDMTIYQMDLGYPAAMCLGVALAMPEQKVVAFEGDGSLFAQLGVLSTIGRYRPENLVVIVMDNGVYASAGDGTVETGTRHGTDLAAVARACGIAAERVVLIEDVGTADEWLRPAMTLPGPWVLVVKVDDSDAHLMRQRRGIIPFDICETAIVFRRELLKRKVTST